MVSTTILVVALHFQGRILENFRLLIKHLETLVEFLFVNAISKYLVKQCVFSLLSESGWSCTIWVRT